jgi:hypothetical protein
LEVISQVTLVAVKWRKHLVAKVAFQDSLL